MAALSLNDILLLLAIIAVAMSIIVLYHLIFVSISLKRVTDRVEAITKDVEAVILKPIGAIDYVLDWFLAAVEGMKKDKKHKGKDIEGK
jgi:hypothetical protein